MSAGTASAPLRRFVIVRELPGIGACSQAELGAAAKTSCAALQRVGTDVVQWQHSYVAGDKTYCIYLATDEEAIKRHATESGFPATQIDEVKTMLDPTHASAAS